MNRVPAKARGVLRPAFEQGKFEHERLAPPEALADYVEHFWWVRWDLRGLPAQRQATAPHPNVHLVVEHGEARVYGVHTARFDRDLAGFDFAFGIKFKPAGCQPFLKASVSTLANSSIPARALFPAVDAMERADAPEALPDMAAALLLAKLPMPDPNVRRVNDIVAAIAEDLTLTSVDRVQEKTGIDKRTLQRLFQKYVGIGPKWVIKRYRLHEAIAQMQAGGTVDFAALATELAYFDQAHFIRDFRALVGQTPADYARSLTRARSAGEDGL
jgi:AraC-like DNA-binding protein